MSSSREVIWVAALALVGCSSGGTADLNGPPSFSGPAAETVITDAAGLRVNMRWFPMPPIRGSDAAELTVLDEAGAPVDGVDITIVPWMPAHGHGTSVQPVVTPTGPGTLVATPLYLFMAGEWQLRMTLSGASNDTALATVDIP